MDASVDDEMDDETNAHGHVHGRPPTDLDRHGRVRICPWTCPWTSVDRPFECPKKVPGLRKCLPKRR